MRETLGALAIGQLHDHLLAQAASVLGAGPGISPILPISPAAGDGMQQDQDGAVWHWIEANHRYNMLLWNEEDKARRTDVDLAEIGGGKRLIDQYNQQRNDAVEAIDEAILRALRASRPLAGARLHSETAGAMIDRLSILSLKVFHMRLQVERTDVGAPHLEKCRSKLARLRAQRQDLGSCLDCLLDDARAGRAYFKVYRQFKMYNDPELNPYLYLPHEAGPARASA